MNMADAPTGDAVSWLIGWRDRATGETGNKIVRAAHLQEAVRGFERDNPSRRVTDVHRSPID